MDHNQDLEFQNYYEKVIKCLFDLNNVVKE